VRKKKKRNKKGEKGQKAAEMKKKVLIGGNYDDPRGGGR